MIYAARRFSLFDSRGAAARIALALILILLVTACQPAPTSAPTSAPPSATAAPPTATSVPPSPTALLPTPTSPPPPTEPPAPPVKDTAALLESLDGYPCPDSDFTCVDVAVPLDHDNPQDGRATTVVFGVLPASGARQGTLVVVTGGPGTSGLLSADAYVASYDPSIPEHFDIVFFDQRGVGLSGGLQCTEAAAVFYRSDWDASTPAKAEELLDTAQTFAESCVAEMGDPEILPYMGTRQAVEDLEAFRQLLDEDQIWLYGESYGTQYAQTYAAAHPDRLAGLMLDGTVDLTLSGLDFLNGQARAFDQVLTETLAACGEDEACAADLGETQAAGAQAVYDGLAVRLRQAPMTFDFPLPSGGFEPRQISFSDLETAASGFLYSQTARMIFQRALAAYARDGSLVPLARTLYNALVLDPETQEPVVDPSYSDAVYYAVQCQDYAYVEGTVEESAQAYLRYGSQFVSDLPRFSSVFYGDLPCVFWRNAQQDPTRPAALTAKGLPTLVLNSLSDPATPFSNAQAVFDALDDGYLITQSGGPHILFAWGEACVDDLVTAYLVDGQVPAQRETNCPGEVATAFVPLAYADAAEYEDPLQALAMIDDEIYFLPEYYYWDGATPTSVGCPFGGVLSFEAVDAGEAFTFDGCAFSKGLVMTGSGLYNYDAETFSLQLSVSGLADGQLEYMRLADDSRQLSGEYAGQVVELSQ
ncbi:MAG: alpha/beta fold hydrolase [Anaerolineae bacterium]|jgi:pimeloyl-ACP methyl ester carboxylesterase|nr:alpha/beta fold hydrolase [Anaerolineae bacterium]